VLREVARVETISSKSRAMETRAVRGGGEREGDLQTWCQDLLNPKDSKVILSERERKWK
jgi:hypothetical protein